MTLLSRIATARTFLKNFSIPCLYIALSAGGLAFSVGSYVGYRWEKSNTLEAKLQLSSFTGQLATNAADGEAKAAERQQKAMEAIGAWERSVNEQIALIPSKVASQIKPDLVAFRSALHADPDLEACLRRPMPSGALGVLRREGGPIAAEADRGAGAP